MKKLCTREIKHFADYLGFTEAEATEITDLFYEIKSVNPESWKVQESLYDVDEYIWEWEGHWHREANWQDYYEDEKANYLYFYADTDEEAEEIFATLDTFKSAVANCSYELSNGTIVVVC